MKNYSIWLAEDEDIFHVTWMQNCNKVVQIADGVHLVKILSVMTYCHSDAFFM